MFVDKTSVEKPQIINTGRHSPAHPPTQPIQPNTKSAKPNPTLLPMFSSVEAVKKQLILRNAVFHIHSHISLLLYLILKLSQMSCNKYRCSLFFSPYSGVDLFLVRLRSDSRIAKA